MSTPVINGPNMQGVRQPEICGAAVIRGCGPEGYPEALRPLFDTVRK